MRLYLCSLTALLLLCSCSSNSDNIAPDNLADDDVIVEQDYASTASAPIAPAVSASPAPETASAPAAVAAAPKAEKPEVKTAGSAAVGGSYTVKPGDTLSRVAARHGVSTAALASANGISPTAGLKVGQKLKLPGAGSSAAPKAKTATATAASSKGAAKARSYSVQKGDTIGKIAAKTGVPAADIIRANNINRSNINLIRVGSTLTIPAKKK